MKLTLVLDKETGDARLMYQDDLVQSLGVTPEVCRLSTIEFEDGRWVVRLASGGPVLFESDRRQVCLDWEQANAGMLLQEITQEKRGALWDVT